MSIVWTKYWGPADDGTVLKGIDLRNIQDDINTTGLADADAIQSFPIDAPTPANDGMALIYNDALAKFEYGNLSGLPSGLGPLPWPTDTAPAGWLLCYGQAVSRATYANLFAVIGTTFGIGDNLTTFNVPDRRGRLGLGKDNMGGVSADRVTNAAADTIGGSLGSETKNIQHTHPFTSGGPSATVLVDDNSGGTNYMVGSETHTHGGTSGNGGSTTQDVMNPVLTTNYIMKI